MDLIDRRSVQESRNTYLITLFLCGDVMTGRGVDQILLHQGNPMIREPFLGDARRYVELTEKIHGPIPRSVDSAYVWGDAIGDLERVAPDLRMINLETSITRSNDYWKEKEIHYRMHPQNIDCITEAKIDVCSLANNHVLDWGYAGLEETLGALRKVKIRSVGAGINLREAESPAVMEIKGKGRVVIYGFGSPTSGVPLSWAASEQKPGVNLLGDFSSRRLQTIRNKVREVKREGDITVASIDWGGNWGYHIPPDQIDFAHHLIDEAGIDIVYGHSSHHVKGIEVYRKRLILYGCGDFLNDYEGIEGYNDYRGDLGLMYFASVEPLRGELIRLQMIPTQIRHFRVNRVSMDDALWITHILNKEGKKFGTRAQLTKDNILTFRWGQSI